MIGIDVHFSQTHGHLLTPTLCIPLFTAMLISITLTPIGVIGSYRPYPVGSNPLERRTDLFVFFLVWDNFWKTSPRFAPLATWHG
jgi:hypothetical protein